MAWHTDDHQKKTQTGQTGQTGQATPDLIYSLFFANNKKTPNPYSPFKYWIAPCPPFF